MTRNRGNSPSNFAFVLLLLVGLLQPLTRAHSQPAAYFGQNTLGGGYHGEDQVQGWEFVANTDITVLKLGLYDGHYAGGFLQAHSVAIWTGSGNLVASAFIPAGTAAPLQNNFRYVDITSTLLHSGQTYVIGAFMPAPVDDYSMVWTQSALSNGWVGFDSRIQFVAYRAGLSPGAISFPQSRWTEYVGAFGPNFIMAVPEPGASALLLLGLACAMWPAQSSQRNKRPPGTRAGSSRPAEEATRTALQSSLLNG